MNFIRHIVSSFQTSPSKTRVAVLVYNTRAFRAFSFGQKPTLRSVLYSLGRIPYIKGGTKTGLAINTAHKFFFRGRSTRSRVAIVLTDGKSQDDVSRPARNLRKAGVRIIAVGTGTRFSVTQLRQIATGRRSVFTSNFKSMLNIVRLIKRKACYGM